MSNFNKLANLHKVFFKQADDGLGAFPYTANGRVYPNPVHQGPGHSDAQASANYAATGTVAQNRPSSSLANADTGRGFDPWTNKPLQGMQNHPGYDYQAQNKLRSNPLYRPVNSVTRNFDPASSSYDPAMKNVDKPRDNAFEPNHYKGFMPKENPEPAANPAKSLGRDNSKYNAATPASEFGGGAVPPKKLGRP